MPLWLEPLISLGIVTLTFGIAYFVTLGLAPMVILTAMLASLLICTLIGRDGVQQIAWAIYSRC